MKIIEVIMSNTNRAILFFALSLSLCVCAANAQSSGGVEYLPIPRQKEAVKR